MRDPVVQFTNSHGRVEERSAYYWSNYSTIHDVVNLPLNFLLYNPVVDPSSSQISHVLNNFNNSLEKAIALDNMILYDGSQISSEYYDLLALSTRQAMGALDFTILKDSSGNWNTSDVKSFLRSAGGIGSGGYVLHYPNNTFIYSMHSRVNAVDVIYAASPIYLYLNPNILGHLLSPLLEYQESSIYQSPYAARDLGKGLEIDNGYTLLKLLRLQAQPTHWPLETTYLMMKGLNVCLLYLL